MTRSFTKTLVETALKLNDKEQALAYQKKAMEVTPRSEVAGQNWQRLGFMVLELGRYQEAAGYFHKALAGGRTAGRFGKI